MKSLIDISIQKTAKKSASRFNELDMVDIFSHDIEIDDPEQRNLGESDEKTETFYDVMLDYCFFDNNDEPARVAAEVLKP